MTETTFRTIAIILYFAGMLAIGWFAYRKTKNSLDNYMLAGRGLRPSVAALSAGASDMSGWLLMGLPGAIYLSGLIERPAPMAAPNSNAPNEKPQRVATTEAKGPDH